MHSEIQIPSTLLEVRRACAWLRERLAGHPKVAVDRAEAVLAEALNNIVFHGCRSKSDATIRISVRSQGTLCRLRIVDDGEPLEQVPDNLHPASMPDPLAEGGRGWAMIQQWSQAVAYHSSGRSNVTEIDVSLLDDERRH